jgi:hypothetical protein
MSFPLLGSSTYVKVFIFESMFRFHFNNPGHHARRKLLNEPTNNVESNFYNSDPFYFKGHGS